MRILIILLFFPLLSQAEELKRDENFELANVLSSLEIISDAIVFKEQGYEVKLYGYVSYDHCSANYYCRGLTQLLISTIELGTEYPVISLYKLPSKHSWRLEKWEHLANHKQGLYIEATSYENDKPESAHKTERFLLSLTFMDAEVNAL